MGKTTLVAQAARRRLRCRRVCALRPLRARTSVPPTILCRSLTTTSPTPPKTLAVHVTPTAANWPGWSRPAPASRTPGTPEHRRRNRALPPLRRGGRAAGQSVSAPARRWCWTTSSGPTSRASSCCAIWRQPSRPASPRSSAPIRHSELSSSHPLTEALAACTTARTCARSSSPALDDTGVLAFMEAAAGQRLEDDGVGLAHACIARPTETRSSSVKFAPPIETGAIYQDDSGRWTASRRPRSDGHARQCAPVIGARVGPPRYGASQILSLAAVIGREFDLDLLAW